MNATRCAERCRRDTVRWAPQARQSARRCAVATRCTEMRNRGAAGQSAQGRHHPQGWAIASPCATNRGRDTVRRAARSRCRRWRWYCRYRVPSRRARVANPAESTGRREKGARRLGSSSTPEPSLTCVTCRAHWGLLVAGSFERTSSGSRVESTRHVPLQRPAKSPECCVHNRLPPAGLSECDDLQPSSEESRTGVALSPPRSRN